jgi:hypothetical protein
MNTQDLIKRIDKLIENGENVIKTEHSEYSDLLGNLSFIDDGLGVSFRAASLNFISRVYTSNNPFYLEFDTHVNGLEVDGIKQGISILKIISEEITNGWLISIKELVSSEIFSDFFEMGEYLLFQQYQDPAAVIFGSILEERLRQLANKNDVKLEIIKDEKVQYIKAEAINTELAKKEVYNKLDQKQITAWLDLRNKAAHGKYAEYNFDQVQNMKNGILEFISRSID